MKYAVITSDNLRHKYFANSIFKDFNVLGIFSEAKLRDFKKKVENSKFDRKVKKYFDEREESESMFFKGNEDFLCNNIIKVNPGEINFKSNVDKLKKLKPDYLFVFGSSLLKDDIINFMGPRRIVNMHLGLSPYYRGSGTNFWPMYDEKLEYVGVTIHFLDIGIDSGDIIVQGQPLIEKGDTPHSIGNKTIIVGVELIKKVLEKIELGYKILGIKQNLKEGKLCLFKDCKPEHVLELVKKCDDGLILDYLSNSDLNSKSNSVELIKEIKLSI